MLLEPLMLHKRGTQIRVAVLMGGTSSEREISLNTGRQIAGALDPAKYEAVAIDTPRFTRLYKATIP